MKRTEIDYGDVGTFPKFAKVAVRIMIEMLNCMMKKKEPPVLGINGRHIYHPVHVMKLLGLGERKMRNTRSKDEIEYMISADGNTIFHYEDQVQEYIDRTFVSSRSEEGRRIISKRYEKFTK